MDFADSDDLLLASDDGYSTTSLQFSAHSTASWIMVLGDLVASEFGHQAVDPRLLMNHPSGASKMLHP